VPLELLARRLEAEHPGAVTTEWLKRKRSGVLVDHRQNGWGKTIAFTEGELYDGEGRLLAKATGTALPTPFQNYK